MHYIVSYGRLHSGLQNRIKGARDHYKVRPCLGDRETLAVIMWGGGGLNIQDARSTISNLPVLISITSPWTGILGRKGLLRMTLTTS